MLGQCNPILGVKLGQDNPILGVILGQYNPIFTIILGHYNPILGVKLGFITPKIGFGITFPVWKIPTEITNITQEFTIFNPGWELKNSQHQIDLVDLSKEPVELGGRVTDTFSLLWMYSVVISGSYHFPRSQVEI